jgi:hypothetical protein
VTQAPTGVLPAAAPPGDPVTVGGRAGFSVPVSLTVVATDVPTPVQQDVFVVDEFGWKLCSPGLAGDLGGTR